LLIERGTFQERALRGLTLRFGIGWRRVFASLDTALLLLLIECEQLFVVVRGSGLERVVIEIPDGIEPSDIDLIMQKQIVRFNEVNQWDLAVGVRQRYHKKVLRERAGFRTKQSPCIFVLRRTFYCAMGKLFCKSVLEPVGVSRDSRGKQRKACVFQSEAGIRAASFAIDFAKDVHVRTPNIS
jgi:hypothetical protein